MSARPAITVATFYPELSERLVAGARAGFAEAGWDEPEVHEVPGAFELPLAASYCASSGRYDGVACLGAVIRGETDHYEYVCAEAAGGIQRVQLDTGIPCSFGVLTVDSLEQAMERTGGDRRDTGLNAALAVVSLAALRSTLA